MPASKSLYTSRDQARETAERNRHSAYRSEFRRDYARLIHSPAFRRLQGKTQLFPASESEFFRNRLTHSIEVAQIAKTIACKVNAGSQQFGRANTAIDTDLVEVAALAHDLGHPPFGHIGEYALNRLMAKAGGFEGNAQTLRILARLEKKGGWRGKLDGTGDTRTGLGLTYRTLSAILKYDNEIPQEVPKRGDQPEVVKGYYASEAPLVRKIKESVLRKPLEPRTKLRTIECEIMDLADDIAYSTYDLEDALKAEFVSPIEVVAAAGDTALLASIAKKVAAATAQPFAVEDALRVLLDTFIAADLFEPSVKRILTLWRRSSSAVRSRARLTSIIAAAGTFDMSDKISQDGFFRTRLTSGLVNEFVQGVRAKWNKDEPAASTVWLTNSVRQKVEVLKHYTYEKLIMSHRLKMVEHRGTEIITAIFETLTSEARKGHLLLPEDFRHWYESAKGNREAQLRVVCDFIAGMTDRYAVEFYSRLNSERPETVFKPY